MNFKSDNMSAVHPLIMAAIAAENSGFASPYGNDVQSQSLGNILSTVFEHEVAFFFASTGTAANSLSLSSICPPYGQIFCSASSHILTDECNCPGLFCNGATLTPSQAEPSKLSLESILSVVNASKITRPRSPKPSCISITEPTELGQIYSVEEIRNISKVAKDLGLKLHMDGARLANAIAYLGCTPAELTWKSGVDILSLGVTKNGGLFGDVILIFDHELCANFDYMHKRSGQLFSKMRFFAVQMMAYFKDDLWLKMAANANKMASILGKGLIQSKKIAIAYPVKANEVFVKMERQFAEALWSKGIQFYEWELEEDVYRFVTSWSTTEEEVCSLLNEIGTL